MDILDAIEAGPGVYPTPGGIVDLGATERVGEDALEVAPGLTVENPPDDPAELALALSRHGMGIDPKKGRTRR